MQPLTFVPGVLALFAWLWITTADSTALHLLRRSLWYFVVAALLASVPAAFLFAVIDADALVSQDGLVRGFAVVLVIVFVEESLKLWASRSEASGIRAFALVSLFGIYELLLFKPFVLAGEAGLDLVLLSAYTIPALFMHLLTAAIYAFRWRSNPAVQFATCLAIHACFNGAAEFAHYLSGAVWLASIFPLVGATFLLIPAKSSQERGSWRRPERERCA